MAGGADAPGGARAASGRGDLAGDGAFVVARGGRRRRREGVRRRALEEGVGEHLVDARDEVDAHLVANLLGDLLDVLGVARPAGAPA
jgi:hypothetical protein